MYIFHVYLYSKQIINFLDETFLKGEKKVKKLIELYKKRKFNNIQLFTLSKRYYELIFILKNYYNFIEYNSILPDFYGIEINSNKIIEQYLSSNVYSDLIFDFIISDESIKENEKISIFSKYPETMDIIFNFWRKIFNDIEVCVEGEKQIIYYYLKPENLYLSKDEKHYYEYNIDRSSRDSKLFSFYENIDLFIFGIIYNYNNERFNIANFNNYFSLELINIIFFIIHNIILIIHGKKIIQYIMKLKIIKVLYYF